MRILVTGGLGFIGSNFIRYLLSRRADARVVNLDNVSYGSNEENLASIGKEKRYRFVRGDVTDSSLTSRLVRQVDAVVNFAAESHVDRSIAKPLPFFDTNANGTLNLLEMVRKARKDVLFLQVGTDEVYGTVPHGSANEDGALSPSSPYAASKAAADLMVRAYFKTYGIKAIITRCTNNFGPFQFPEKFIPKIIVRAALSLKLPIYGTGSQVRDWIYVEDHCEALDLVLKKGRAGEIYNIAGRNELTNLQVTTLILKQMGRERSLLEHVEDRPGHDFRYSLNDSKIRGELGWRPHHSFREGLSSTVQWYLRNEDWWRPIASESVLSSQPWRLKW